MAHGKARRLKGKIDPQITQIDADQERSILNKKTPTKIENKKIVCFVYANGCERARSELARLIEFFKANRWIVTNKIKDGSLVIVSTCGYDSYAEMKSLRLLDVVKKKINRNGKLVVTGCLCGLKDKILKEKYDAIPIKSKDICEFDKLIHAEKKLNSIHTPLIVDEYVDRALHAFCLFDRCQGNFPQLTEFVDKTLIRLSNPRRFRSFFERNYKMPRVVIAYGCEGDCSYCAIRYSCGSLVSRPSDEILQDVERSLKKGYRFVNLIAGDVGSYGHDIDSNIAALLSKIFLIHEDFKLVIHDFNVRWLIHYGEDLIQILKKNQHMIESISVPIQSGSTHVLRRMRRHHTGKDAEKILSRLRQQCPKIKLLTHVMVGFPGESTKDFNLTIDLLRNVNFSNIVVIKYSDITGTDSSYFNDKIPATIKRKRILKLLREFPRTSF